MKLKFKEKFKKENISYNIEGISKPIYYKDEIVGYLHKVKSYNGKEYYWSYLYYGSLFDFKKGELIIDFLPFEDFEFRGKSRKNKKKVLKEFKKFFRKLKT